MPRYYFHVFDGLNIRDVDGLEMRNDEQAQIEAVKLAGALIREKAASIVSGDDWHMEVTDSCGLILFRLDFVLYASAPRTLLRPR